MQAMDEKIDVCPISEVERRKYYASTYDFNTYFAVYLNWTVNKKEFGDSDSSNYEVSVIGFVFLFFVNVPLDN